MKNIVLILVLGASFSFAQGIKIFEGHWAGDLYSFNGKDSNKVASMQLIIAPTDTSGVWQYKMIYSDKDIRDYRIKTINSERNKFVLDEGNEILLAQDLFGKKFISCFEVGNSLLMVSLEKRDDTLLFEVSSLSVKDKKKSGKGNKETPFVYSYPVAGFQRAVLFKK
jgi:hypothetical protein